MNRIWINAYNNVPEINEELLFIELLSNQYVHHGYWDGERWFSMTNNVHIKPSRVVWWAYIPELPDIDSSWKIREKLIEEENDIR